MARTPTTQIPLGFKAPAFNLPDVISNKHVKLNDISCENGLVVMFICNHCPFVVHVIEQIVDEAPWIDSRMERYSNVSKDTWSARITNKTW